MININGIAEEMNITVVSGRKVPPVSFKVIDANGDEVTDYEPVMYVKKSVATDTIEAEQTVGDGLTKDGAVTTLDINLDLPPRTYRHYIDATITGIGIMSLYAGLFDSQKPGAQTGGRTALTQYVCQLPILPVEGSPGTYDFAPADFSSSDFNTTL